MSEVLGVGLCGDRDEKRVLAQSESVSAQQSEKERTKNCEGRIDVEKETFWRHVLEGHAASGLNIRAFCKRESLSESSFYDWRRKILARDNDKPSQRKQFGMDLLRYLDFGSYLKLANEHLWISSYSTGLL